MRLALDPRARRLLRRVPRTTAYTALELALLSLLALQCARLVWTIVTPVGPVGPWQAAGALNPLPAGSGAALGDFDPFFRLSGSTAPLAVTSLNLKLFGVREDRASGRGSAIISTPEGQQRSFAVGDEIVPGVTLTAVGFDNVTISRSGVPEQLFLDQSGPATEVGGDGSTPPASAGSGGSVNFAPVVTPAPPAPAPPPARAAEAMASQVRFQPRMSGTAMTGVTVQPQGDGTALRASGLAPGDVIVSVNGQRIRSPEQARSLAGQIGGQRGATVQVERNGRVEQIQVNSEQ
jgi:general secretion pathway protein C